MPIRITVVAQGARKMTARIGAPKPAPIAALRAPADDHTHFLLQRKRANRPALAEALQGSGEVRAVQHSRDTAVGQIATLVRHLEASAAAHFRVIKNI
jgi:hypothetical protein